MKKWQFQVRNPYYRGIMKTETADRQSTTAPVSAIHLAAAPKIRAQSRDIHGSFQANPHAAVFVTGPDLASAASSCTSPDVAAELAALERDGFVILRDVLGRAELQALRTALAPHLRETGRNRFEGEKTNRAYALLGKGRSFDGLAEHPRIMRLLEHTLLPNPLLTAYQAIQILPGEIRQPLHYDDQFMTLPRPRKHLSVATVWAIDDFTADNGATVVFPGSHKWGNEVPPHNQQPISVVMPAGSVVFFLSTLWHGGGPNTSSAPRLAVSAQYCEPFVRQQENQQLCVDFATAITLSASLQSLMGWSIHPPFIGQVDGRHPLKRLEQLVGRGGADSEVQVEPAASATVTYQARL